MLRPTAPIRRLLQGGRHPRVRSLPDSGGSHGHAAALRLVPGRKRTTAWPGREKPRGALCPCAAVARAGPLVAAHGLTGRPRRPRTPAAAQHPELAAADVPEREAAAEMQSRNRGVFGIAECGVAHGRVLDPSSSRPRGKLNSTRSRLVEERSAASARSPLFVVSGLAHVGALRDEVGLRLRMWWEGEIHAAPSVTVKSP